MSGPLDKVKILVLGDSGKRFRQVDEIHLKICDGRCWKIVPGPPHMQGRRVETRRMDSGLYRGSFGRECELKLME